MRKLTSIFIVLGMLAGVLSAQPVAGLQAQIDLFRAGRRVWDPRAMESARAGFAEAARQQPGDYLPLYWQAVNEFYLMLCYGLEDSTGYDPARAAGLLDEAEETMKAAIAARPQEAECHALLSSVYGFRIKMHPMSAVWNGPKVLSLQRDALASEAENPRVLYIIGAGYYRAPRVFRNTDKARRMLEQAAALFALEPPNRAADWPQWGREECLGLLGDMNRKDGNRAAAQRCYQAALELNPHYTPAQRGLREIEHED